MFSSVGWNFKGDTDNSNVVAPKKIKQTQHKTNHGNEARLRKKIKPHDIYTSLPQQWKKKKKKNIKQTKYNNWNKTMKNKKLINPRSI